MLWRLASSVALAACLAPIVGPGARGQALPNDAAIPREMPSGPLELPDDAVIPRPPPEGLPDLPNDAVEPRGGLPPVIDDDGRQARFWASPPPDPPVEPAPPAVVVTRSRLPVWPELRFESNDGQFDPAILFSTLGNPFASFESDGVTFRSPHGKLWRLRFAGSTHGCASMGRDGFHYGATYYEGNGPRADAGAYARVRYVQVWRGIDVVFDGAGGDLSLYVLVGAGADPAAASFVVDGLDLTPSPFGGLWASGASLSRPAAHQYDEGRWAGAPASWTRSKDGRIGFGHVPHAFDVPLVIGPITLQDARAVFPLDEGTAIASFGSRGAVVVAGTSTRADALRGSLGSSRADAFVTLLEDSEENDEVVTLVPRRTVYLGGRSDDRALDVAVNRGGAIYVVGSTRSADFPVAMPLERWQGEMDGFVAKVTSVGGILSSTYLGGRQDDFASSVAVDDRDIVCVVGETRSDDFPRVSAMQKVRSGESDGFVAQLDLERPRFVYATYLGGKGEETIAGVALDGAGDIYVVGTTGSADFPIYRAVQPLIDVHRDAFVAKLSGVGSYLHYTTYIGGRGDEEGTGIVAGSDGVAYVTGLTDSDDFPVVAPLEPRGGGTQAFLTAVRADGVAFLQSTIVGGRELREPRAIAVGGETVYVRRRKVQGDGVVVSRPPRHGASRHLACAGTGRCRAARRRGRGGPCRRPRPHPRAPALIGLRNGRGVSSRAMSPGSNVPRGFSFGCAGPLLR
ncbi:MAG: SBBP repeat-containing protein [Acidobacteriota bacterium]